MPKPDHSVVVLSGGQDSATCLFLAMRAASMGRGGADGIYCITFNYGQRHNRELEAAAKVVEIAQKHAAFYGDMAITHEVLTLPDDVLHGTSPLTDKTAPLETYGSFDEMQKVIGDRREKTFVPMRNQLFLTIAMNRAAVLGAVSVVTGVCEADGANYDDCREVFINALTDASNYALGNDHRGDVVSVAEFESATGQKVADILPEGAQLLDIQQDAEKIEIVTPLIGLKKAEICKLAQVLPGLIEALAYTHTAYSGEYPPVTQDHATVLRAEGFRQAGMPDPLILRAIILDGFWPVPGQNAVYDKLVRETRGQSPIERQLLFNLIMSGSALFSSVAAMRGGL